MVKISLAIPTYNSSRFVSEAFRYVLADSRISELVICDDASADADALKSELAKHNSPKIRLIESPYNQKAFENKALAVANCHEEYVVLLDSDNVITPAYLDTIFALTWQTNVLYCPAYARPLLDFRAFADLTISSANLSGFLQSPKANAFLNDGNYFFHRLSYLNAFSRMPKDSFLSTLDVLYFNSLWIEQGATIQIVTGLWYFHRHRGDSFFMQNKDKSAKIIETMNLRNCGLANPTHRKPSVVAKVRYKLWAVKNMVVYKLYEGLKLYR